MRIGSLFTGVGGLDMAVQDVFGGEHAWFSEIDKAASKVLAYRFPGVPNLGDITQIDWATVEPVDVLCGGFPCQDVSAAGKRAGIKHGTRSGLWAVFAEAIDALRPQYVVIENVRGLLSAAAHRTVKDDAGDYLEPDPAGVGNGTGRPVLRAAGAVLGDLADLGYDAQWATVAAADVGAPHRRERVFIVAYAAEQFGSHGTRFDGSGRALVSARAGTSRRDSAGDSAPRVQLLGRGARCEPHGSADPSRNGWDEERAESAGIVGGFDAAVSGDEPGLALLPTPCAQQSGNTPENHLAKKPGRKVVTDLAILVENGLMQSGGALLPTPRATDPAGAHSRSSAGFRPQLGEVVRQLGGECRDEGGEVVNDDGAVPVLPADGGGDDTLPIALNGDGVAVDVGGCVDGHDACVPVELAGTKPEPGVALLPTPNADVSRGVRSPEGIAKRIAKGDKQFSLEDAVALLPTPRSSDCFGAGQHGDGGMDLRTTVTLLPTPKTTDLKGTDSKSDHEWNSPNLSAITFHTARWGRYAPAIARWEQVTGQPAPAPTEPNKNGNPRLSAAFSEWLMGWPPGWVTDPAIGISRNDKLRCVGNGVVSLQAVAALRYLLGVAAASEVAANG